MSDRVLRDRKSTDADYDALLDAAARNPDAFALELDRLDCEERFLDFVRQGWHVLEPARSFVEGWHLDAIAEHLEAVTAGQIKRLLINVPPGCTKALPVETPVLTTWGWKNHGDLVPGDYVFGPDGLPKRVLGVTPKRVDPCSEVEFADGARITASDGHLWPIERDECRTPRVREPMVVATRDLRTGGRPDSVPVPNPVQLPPRRLLIDPYLLGAWLGDGASTSGCLYASDRDVHAFLEVGEIAHTQPAGGARKQAFHRVRVPGLQVRLRVLGLLGNKHIPDDYLEASVEQRLHLLQGLMDTDGSCSKSGECKFSTALPHLAEQVSSLVCSLGMRAHVRSRHTTLKGKVYGPHYAVRFRPLEGEQIFRLARKQARVRASVNARTRSRYVKEVRPVGAALVSCIQCEGEVYLAGRDFIPTHNSRLVNVYWPAWEWGPRNRPWTQFISASYSEALSIRDNRHCRTLMLSGWYQQHWGDRFQLLAEQNQKIRYDNTKMGWRFATSVGGVATGERGDRFIIDDPHNVKEAESALKRDSALQWFSEVVSTRFNDEQSAMVVIMQRVHEKDVSGMILAKELGFDHLCLPMEYEHNHPTPSTTTLGFKDPRTKEGELLCPARFSAEGVKALKKDLRAWGGVYAEAGQLQQRPTPRGGGMFHKADFQMPESGPGQMVHTARGWDLAASKSSRASYTVGCKLGLDAEGRIWILDVVRAQATPFEVEQMMRAAAKKDSPDTVQDLPQDPGQAGKAQKAALARVLQGHMVRFSPETGSKETRAQALAAQAEAGNLFVVDAPWTEDLIDEFATFLRGAHDDQVDAASRAYARLLQMSATKQTFFAAPEVIHARS